MKDLIVVFIDYRLKIYKVYRNQTAYHWRKIANEMNQMRYLIVDLGGSRKEIKLEQQIAYLKRERFSECKGEIDFHKVRGVPKVE